MDKNKATIINLYGGPGTGKSTTAAEVFSAMKRAGRKVELVTEYAKDLTYQKAFNKMRDQGYLFATQHHRIWQVSETVDFVVTDSPLLMSLVYANEHPYLSDKFKEYVIDVYKHYNNVDIFLERNVSKHPYHQYGRTQTLSEAVELDNIIKSMLNKTSCCLHSIKISETTCAEILAVVMS